MYNLRVSTFLENNDIKAVAFDIDGTLYRAWKLNLRMAFHFLRHSIFFLHYGLARKDLHMIPATKHFVKIQSEFMAKRLKCTPEEADKRLDEIVYSGLKKYFPKITPCKGSIELIKDLKAAGYKIALLSDFPPEQKGDLWGVKDYCDVMLGTEAIGALKPSTVPFETLAKELQLPPENILYVGNSHKYDVVGSKNAGFKSAWFVFPTTELFGKKSNLADITFYKYSQLREILIK